MIGKPSPGPPGFFGCAKVGWPLSSIADAVSSATARDAGIARRALLGLSKSIRNPIPPISPQTRDPGGWGQRAGDHASRRDDDSKARRLRHERGDLTVWARRRSLT